MADTKRDESEPIIPPGEEEDRDEQHHEDEVVEQQDLNQGIDTGTHDSTRQGVDWGRAYRQRGAGVKSDKPKDDKI